MSFSAATSYVNGVLRVRGIPKNTLIKRGAISLGSLKCDYYQVEDILRCSRIESLHFGNNEHKFMFSIVTKVSGAHKSHDLMNDDHYLEQIVDVTVDQVDFELCSFCRNPHKKVCVVKGDKAPPLHGQCFTEILPVLKKDNRLIMNFLRSELPNWVSLYVDSSTKQDYVLEQLMYFILRQIWLKFKNNNIKMDIEKLPIFKLKKQSVINEENEKMTAPLINSTKELIVQLEIDICKTSMFL